MKTVAGLVILILSILLLSCDGIFPAQSKPDVPQDHTLKISGALHKEGLFEPLDLDTGCTTAVCHGNDLQGGTVVSNKRHITVSSCYECHGALWERSEFENGEHD